MGGKKKVQNPKPQEAEDDDDLLSTLGDFTKRENWDKFFTLRGTDDSFEWYADWPQLKPPLLSLLSNSNSHSPAILVPGCGNSCLSEHLYDAGFPYITNLDFSKVVISDMLRRNVRDRRLMRWRLMDITSMQLDDHSFDAVLDKGGLDALMEPQFGPKLGDQYLSEVKRVLKFGGSFICLTLGESHVLGLLFPKFRVGWKVTLHCIPQKPSSKPSLTTFMVVAVKTNSSAVELIVPSFDPSSVACNKQQAQGLHAALDAENEVRKGQLDGSNLKHSLEDLKLRPKGDLVELSPGRRVQLSLGGGGSLFRYKAVVLDSKPQPLAFSYHCAVLLVPKTRVREWLFSSEEGQWMVVENASAARLIMILLDSSHAILGMEELQKDLSPLVKLLEPENHASGAQIPFMSAGDGIKHRKVVHQITSEFTGPIVIEDVIYENFDDDDLASKSQAKEPVFRRLTFQRSESLVQSEALLINKISEVHGDDTGRKKPITAGKSKENEKQKTKQSQQSTINDLSNNMAVDHTFVASSYHTGIVAGFMLILPYLESMASSGGKVEAVVIGLGAGLLPMFLHSCMDFLHIEVVELDPVVLRLAKEYFGFCEDESLKVHLDDGIQFLQKLTETNSQAVSDISPEDITNNTSSVAVNATNQPVRKLDIIVVDVDSSDSSSGLSCPAADFVEDSFFTTVKDALSEQGLFVINLVSRSQSIKDMVVSRMRVAFSHLYCLELEDDVNEVLFAVNTNACVLEESISAAATQLQKLLKFKNPERSQGIVDMAKKIRHLK